MKKKFHWPFAYTMMGKPTLDLLPPLQTVRTPTDGTIASRPWLMGSTGL